jgi:hypothetical protein
MSRRDWYREHEGPAEEHAVDVAVQARLENDPEYQELRAQVLELGGMLSHLLDGEALDLWLRVETALNDRWAMFADEAYNVGVDAGLAMRVVDEVLAQARVDARMQPAASMRALAAALARIAEQLG